MAIEWTTLDQVPREKLTGPVPLPLEQQEAYRQKLLGEWSKTEAGQLCEQFHSAYQAYKNYLAAHPYEPKRRDGARVDSPEHQVFENLYAFIERRRRNLERARRAERCAHRKDDGTRCGSSRMRGSKLCYLHRRMETMRSEKVDMPLIEDPHSIQLALMKTVQALVDGRVDMKLAGLLLYALQIASSNINRLNPARHREEEPGRVGRVI